MTTNSPNPVDGDVQELIADCRAEIAEIEKMLSLWGAVPYLKSQLKRQYAALAALTVEPVYQFIVNNPDKDGYIEWADCNPDYFSNESSDNRRILYTTPPAQLLRPVELPKGRLMQIAFETDPVNADMCLCISRDAAVRAIREAGYEVKND
ncbi:hypothetical protein ACO03_02940 [Pantoea ananatis]|nr:hypothetical protein ACO03_02940 [Pantoea ananatis]